jgi:hypothetical protein
MANLLFSICPIAPVKSQDLQEVATGVKNGRSTVLLQNIKLGRRNFAPLIALNAITLETLRHIVQGMERQ